MLKMKKTLLRKKGKSDISKIKDRIQKLLTAIVRLRDGGCILRNYPEAGACSGYTAADHLITRSRSVSYGDTRNVLCVCQRHHIYWKPINPLLYSSIIKRHLDEKTFNWLERTQLDGKTYSFTLWDWTKIEISLKQELLKLSPDDIGIDML